MRTFKISRRTVLSAPLLASAALALPVAAQAAKPPRAITGGISHRRGSEALLEASINPNGGETSYYFQYGPTAAYGIQTSSVGVGAGTVAIKVGQAVVGLQPGVVYHYRVVAANAFGTTLGRDRTFAPAGTKLTFSIAKPSASNVFGSPFSVSGTLSGTSSANHEVVLQASPFPYAAEFTNFGAPVLTNAAGGFSFPVAGLSQSTQFRVITLDALPVYSQIVTERVAVRVSIRVLSTSRKGYVRFSGTVAPAQVGAPIVFQWLKPGGHPVSVGSAVVKKGSAGVSRFSSGVVLIRHGHGGAYRAFVKVLSGAQVSGYSPTVLIHSAPARVRKARRARARRHRRP
jgi:hypothetical protein